MEYRGEKRKRPGYGACQSKILVKYIRVLQLMRTILWSFCFSIVNDAGGVGFLSIFTIFLVNDVKHVVASSLHSKYDYITFHHNM